jgi:RecA-family ATPase
MATLQMEDNPFARKVGVQEWQKKELVVPKPDEYLIEELVPANSLVSLQTNGVYGKTTLAMQLALTVAFGIPFLGTYPCLQPGKVLYLNARDADDDNHRRFKRLVRELSKTVPDIQQKIDDDVKNLTHISMYDECYDVTPHLIDMSGSMTKTYTHLRQFCDYYKTKLIVLDPVEEFFPPNIKNITELYLKLRQLNATVLLIVGDKKWYDLFHEVEVGMCLHENGVRIQSVYTGHRDIALQIGAGIWIKP